MSEQPKVAGPGGGRALVPFVQPRAGTAWARNAALGALLLGAAGVGALGVYGAQLAWMHQSRAVAQAEATAGTLRQLQSEVGRLRANLDSLRAADGKDDPVRTLKHSVDALRGEIEQVRTADGAALTQMSGKLDKAERDPAGRLADIAARLDRIEHAPARSDAASAAPPPAPKMADLSTRLDRIERQLASTTPTGSIPVAPVAGGTTAVPRTAPAKADGARVEGTRAENAKTEPAETRPAAPHPSLVDAYVVRDVYDGMALVEARNGGLREIEPGEFLPGAGEVRSIERRGRNWVVLTSRGVIGPAAF